jgi:hypothetical protein
VWSASWRKSPSSPLAYFHHRSGGWGGERPCWFQPLNSTCPPRCQCVLASFTSCPSLLLNDLLCRPLVPLQNTQITVSLLNQLLKLQKAKSILQTTEWYIDMCISKGSFLRDPWPKQQEKWPPYT